MSEVISNNRDRLIVIIAGIALSIVVYLLFFFSPFAWLYEGKQVGVIKTERTVRRRHAGSLTWQNIKGTEPVYLKDVVFIPRNTEAIVVLTKQGTYDLPPDTMVQFDEASLDNIEITLLEEKKLPGPPPSPLLPLKLRSAKLTMFLRDLHPLELRLSELKQRTMERVFREVTLARVEPIFKNHFDLDRLEDFEVKLISPLPDKYNLKGSEWMKMSWSNVPIKGISYTLEVSKDSTFRRVLPHTTKKNLVQIQFEDEATYYWRVKAMKDGQELVSEPWNFTMVRSGGKTHGPTQIRIPTGLPQGYPVEVSKLRNFSEVVKSGLNSEPKCDSAGLARGVYYCRVRATTGTKIVKIYRFEVK